MPHESNWSVHNKKCFVDAYTVTFLRGDGSSATHSQEIYTSNELATIQGRYCPECAKHGYHAWFHQLDCFDYCLLHPDQNLLVIKYPLTQTQKESFYQQIGTRVVDLMDNEDFRREIESKIYFDFDRISAIDIMEYRWGAQSPFRSKWYETTLQTLRECCSRKAFTAARKVTVITPNADKRIAEWVEKYLRDSVVPWLNKQSKAWYIKMGDTPEEAYINVKRANYQIANSLRNNYNPKYALYLMMHQAFFKLCQQLGGIEKYETVLKTIHAGYFDTQLCDYNIFGKIITLILTSHYSNARNLSRLYQIPHYVTGIPSLSSKLDFNEIDLNQVINIHNGDYRNMEVPILAAILEDILSHTAIILGELMAGKRCLTGGRVTSNIYSSFFCLPVSQYIAIWNAGTVELWACDPNLDNLLNNIRQANEHYTKTGRLTDPHTLEPV